MLLEQNNSIKTKILNAIMEDPEIVLIMKERYIDEDIWKFCIEREPSLFKKMKHPSESLCMFACEVDGSNLRYIKNKFTYIQITNVMVYTAVRSNPKAILYAPKKFINEGLMEMAFMNDPSLMAYFDNISDDCVMRIIEEKPYAIQYVKHPSDDIICDMIRKSPEICVYLNDISDNALTVLEDLYPNYFSLYKNNQNK